MRLIRILVVIFILIFALEIQSQDILTEIKEAFEKGLKEYENQDTQSLSIASFNLVLEKVRLLSEEMLKSDEVKEILRKTHEYKGLAHFNLGEMNEAENSFNMLIILDPALDLNENIVSPKITKFYKKIKDKVVGYLTVTAIPTDSEIYIDNQLYGICPINSKGIYIGNHILTIKHEGFDPIEKEISVEAGKKIEILDVSLLLVSGNCLIRTIPSDVKVNLDGDFLGTTRKMDAPVQEQPETVSMDVGELLLEYISPGVHEISLQKECYSNIDSKINVVIGQNQYPVYELETSTSSVSISADTSGIEVYLDEKFLGNTPINVMTLCSGVYSLKAVFPDKRLFYKTYDFKQNEILSIFAEPKPTITFLGLFSRKSSDYLPEESTKLFDSLKGIEELSIINVDYTSKILDEKKIRVGDLQNYDITKKGVILKVKDELADKLSSLFYSELFLFGIVDSQNELSMNSNIYLFSIYETKVDRLKVSLSDFSNNKTINDRLVSTFDFFNNGLGVCFADNASREGPVIYDLLGRIDVDLKIGDVLLAIDGKKITSALEIQKYLTFLAEDKVSVKLDISREGTTSTKEINLVKSRIDLPLSNSSLLYNKIIVELLMQLDKETIASEKNLLNYNLALSFIHFNSWDKALTYLDAIKPPFDDVLPAGLIEFYKGFCYQKLGLKDKSKAAYLEAMKDSKARFFNSCGTEVASIAKIYMESIDEKGAE